MELRPYQEKLSTKAVEILEQKKIVYLAMEVLFIKLNFLYL